MPVVPSASVPTVGVQPNTGVPYQTAAGATPDAFGANIGTAEQGLAKQIESTGDMLAKHALKMQDEVNASTAKDLFLAGDVDIGKLTVDYNSLEGANRVNAYPKFIEDIGAVREKYKQLAPNTDVARRFDQDFARRVGYSIVDGARSAATANKQYQHETNKAVQANAMSHIAANAQDDNRFDTELKIGLDATRSNDTYKGASKEVQEQVDTEFTSQAWSTRLQSMAKNDPLRARELFDKNKGSIDGVTQLKLQDGINQQIINVQSRVDADKIVQSGALVSESLEAKIKKFEGYSAKEYSDYKQTSSGYGTKYQPGDEKIPPDQLRAIHEQRLKTEVGRAATIVDNFAPGLPKGTRDALIDLTYNAGQAWTSAGLGIAIRSGDDARAKEIYQQYTKAGGVEHDGLQARREAMVAGWGGEPVDSDPVSKMGTALERAKEQAIKVFPDDPANQAKYLDTVQNRIKADYNVLQGAARDMQLQTRNIVQSELFRQEKPPVSYDQLSPKAQQAYDQAPPQLQHSFDLAMRKNSTADIPLTAERQSRFDTLRGEMINEPEKGMARDMSNQDLPRAQSSILLKMQQDRKALVEKGTTLNSAMTSIQGLLNDAGIGKSATDATKNAEYNKFSGVFTKALDDFMAKEKRPANDKERQEIGKGLLKDIVTSPGFIFGDAWPNTDRAYRVISDKTPITINGTDAEITARISSVPRGATVIVNGEKFTKK